MEKAPEVLQKRLESTEILPTAESKGNHKSKMGISIPNEKVWLAQITFLFRSEEEAYFT